LEPNHKAIVWKPELEIKNAYNIQYVDSEFGNKQCTHADPQTGHITYTMHCQGMLREDNMDLHTFPFDTQYLSVIVSTKGVPNSELALRDSGQHALTTQVVVITDHRSCTSALQCYNIRYIR
jgi:hypothetical protein